MSHFMLSQGKFVFAIFAFDHEFLASDDASSSRELRSVNSIYIWSENLVAESEAKDGGN